MNTHDGQDLTELRILVRELTASLAERCPRNTADIAQLKKDMDGQHQLIRELKENHAKYTALLAIIQSVVIAGAIKLFVG